MNDTLYLYNPKSNNGNAVKMWQEARKKYLDLPEEAVDITKTDIGKLIKEKNPRLVVIAGGDGAVNSVCRAIVSLQKRPTLTILPFGTGNAISYCLGVETIEKALSVLEKKDNKVTVDLMRTNSPKLDTGIFNISAGFDARIVLQKNDYRYIGVGAYVVSAIRSLFSHPEQDITFTIDHSVTLSARASSLVISNCPIIGKNFIISPAAKLNDGLLDCTLFSTKYSYLTNLRLHGFIHPLYTELGKVRFKAKHIRIDGEPIIQIDGDPIIQKKPLEIEILPKQVTFLRNTEKNINQQYLPFIT